MSFTTSLTMLEKIAEGDEISWNRFAEMYSPLIRVCGRSWGLTVAERGELVQDVLVNFFKASKTFRYDRLKGRFRTYLRTIVRNCTFAIIRKRGDVADDAACMKLIDCAFDEKWDAEWHNYLLSEAIRVMQSEMEPLSWLSFERYVLRNEPPAKVANELGVTVNAVYINKSRTLDQLRRVVRQLEKL